MTTDSKLPTHKTALPTEEGFEEITDFPQLHDTRTQARTGSIREYVNNILIWCHATHLTTRANRISCNAKEYFDAARDNFELGQDLDIDDTHQRRDLHILVAQADEYRRQARQLQGQAEALRMKAKQLCRR